MAETTGLVQALSIVPDLSIVPGIGSQAVACVGIGPTPADTELLFVRRDNTDSVQAGAFKNSIVDALVTALVNRREVKATHADDDAKITKLSIEPA